MIPSAILWTFYLHVPLGEDAEIQLQLTEQLPQAPQGQALMSKIRAAQAVAAAPRAPGPGPRLSLNLHEDSPSIASLHSHMEALKQTAFCKGHGV